MTIPSPFANRVEKLRHLMRAAGAEVFLCDHAEMLYWLSGYTVSETFYRGVVVPLQGDSVWVLRAIDTVPCRAATWMDRVVGFPDDADAHEVMAGVLSGFAPRVIAADFASYGFTAHTRDRLSKLLPEARFVDLHDVSNTLRSVKDLGELDRITAAARIGDGAMAAIVAALEPGMRPRDAAAIAAAHFLTQGADDYWVGPISISRRARGSGDGMGFLHATFTEDRLAKGDILHVELVPRVSNYSARFMRSISLSAPSDDDLATMTFMRNRQDDQFAAIRPGARAADVDAILRNAMLDRGLRDDYPNITGYQVGIYAKTPRSSDTSLSLHPGADWRFEAGQVFHLYTTARGLALSETVAVSDDGCQIITTTPRRMLQAGERFDAKR